MARRKNARVAALLSLCFPLFVFGQNTVRVDTTNWISLDEVQVNALAVSSSRFEYQGAISTIGQEALLNGNLSIATDLANQVPGVYWQSGALNTNRITIRGVGSRTPFSTNKIRAYYEDIPLTDGSGETTIEDIDLAMVGGIEIQKGANSSLYGSGIGGTIFLKRPEVEGNSIQLNSSLGSFGLLSSGISHEFAGADLSGKTSYQRLSSDGYRANNQFDRHSFLSTLSKEYEKVEFGFIGLFIKQKAFIPSSLGITDFQTNPEQAAANWSAAEGFEDYRRWLVGANMANKFDDGSTLTTSIYHIGRNAYEVRPFNILEERNSGWGVRSRWQKELGSFLVHTGVEAYRDVYQSRIFDNELPDAGSRRGILEIENEQPRSYVNLFAQGEVDLTESLSLVGGLSLNRTQYTLRGVSPQRSESSVTYDWIASPRISLGYEIGAGGQFYASLSRGFSPISVDGITDETGNLNESLQPEIGLNREIGYKLITARTNLELAAYSMTIADLLVTRRTAEDVFFEINAGETLHNGLELSVESLLLSKGKSSLTGAFNYSLSDFTFKRFVDDADDFSGNQLTGVPRHQLGINLTYQLKGFRTGFFYQITDKIPITDDNSIFSESYQLVNFFAGYELLLNDYWAVDLAGKVNNLFDERYASMLNINTSFGAEPRYFYPGLPINYQVSFSLTYNY